MLTLALHLAMAAGEPREAEELLPAHEKRLTLALTAPFPVCWQLSGWLIGNASGVPKIRWCSVA